MAGDEKEAEFLARTTARRSSFLRDLTGFLAENKKWWLAPIIVSVLGLGLLVFFGGTAAAPFIYTLF